jgi:hypothetical protein
MSVSGIGSPGGFDVSKMASTIASKVVKNLDSNGDGTLDKKEFVAGLTANGVSAADAAKQFDSIDTKKTGTISQADIESAIKVSIGNGGPPPGGKGGPPHSGGPTGGPPPSGAGQAGGSSTTGASSKTYDKKDLNQDGTVSSVEELVYDLKHGAVSSSNNKPSAQTLGSNINVTA